MIEIWLKAIHIAALAVWTGGLVALPGLLGVTVGPNVEIDDEAARKLNFARRGFEFIVSPAAVLTVASGTALIFVADFEIGWLALKLLLVGFLALLHMLVGRGLGHGGRQFAPGKVARGLLTGTVAVSVAAVIVTVLFKPVLQPDNFPAWLTNGRPDVMVLWFERLFGA